MRWVSRTAFHAGDGNDRITGGDGNDIIHGDNGNDIISGEIGYDLLYGGDGADLIVGGYGADQMSGGLGDDRIYVDNAADKVFEAAGQGNDTAYCSVSHTLAAGQHVETIATTNLGATGAINLAGNELGQKIVGNNGRNILNGNGGNDVLYGYAGDDTLIGGTGIDQMHGGVGSDVFRVDHAADKVFETAGQGADTVLASASYALAAGQSIERLATSLLTAVAAIRLTGNEFDQTISGNNGANIVSGNGGTDVLFGHGGNDTLNGGSGDDVLDGGSGNDRLDGGDGNDTYVLANGADVVVDIGGTLDAITSTISRSLANYATIEKLTLLGTANINGTGNGLANTIVGNAGNNTLNGGLGRDVLTGGTGNDSFRFDTALSAANVDRITDFSVPRDTIVLENAVFKGLAAGTLAASAFVKNTTGLAMDANDRIIFETDTGKLFYDSNGSASGGAINFATLAPNLTLTNADFQVI
ncbi:hypothetical protein MesoLjLb_35770 [Mesorhizobium sp. L-8-3]|nr:hypothetical protein MesoLjLb_35770 [Mesorhizobium sp. L-8-3]